MSFREYPLTVRRLLTVRALRSVGQGVLVVDFVLYLKALDWHAAAIGLLLSGAGLGGAGLALLVGVLSDRYGRRSFILVNESITIVAGALALFTPNPFLLSAAAVLASFGRGQGGGAGAFGPAEQAWLAMSMPPKTRSRLFSLNAAIGFVGMGAGALIAGVVPLLAHWFPGAAAFRPLFLVVVLGSSLNWILLWPLPDERPAPKPEAAPAPEDTEVVRQENRQLIRLTLTNALNGLAVGLISPLISYWFAVRFGVGPAFIGGLMALTFVGTGLSNVATGRIAELWGPVRSTVAIRLAGVLFMLAMVAMPTFWWAGAFYVLRSLLNRGSVGARQAVSVSLTRAERRGLASSLNQVSMRLPGAIGPTVAGYLMEGGDLITPFIIAAGLQLLYALSYGYYFRDLDRDLSQRGRRPVEATHAGGATPP